MHSQRWKVKELIPADLIPTRNLITVSLLSPKSPSIADSYQSFKSHISKSKRSLLCHYTISPVREQKPTKLFRPRFSHKLPSNYFKPFHTVHSKTTSPPQNLKSELYLENLIKNRQNLQLPLQSECKSQYRSLKERLLNTRLGFFKNMSLISKSISERLKSKAGKEIGAEWNNQPVRKWEARKMSNETPKPQKSVKNRIKDKNFTDAIKDPNIIDNVLEDCKESIINWPSP